MVLFQVISDYKHKRNKVSQIQNTIFQNCGQLRKEIHNVTKLEEFKKKSKPIEKQCFLHKTKGGVAKKLCSAKLPE
jgi:predicted translin family RNA/ssDNA-binding protein